MNNPFQLFELPLAFNLDYSQLQQRYLALQKTLHPDNFAHRSAQEQRLAMQKSAEINDAFHTLKDPITRADAIIALQTGEMQDIEQKSSQDMAFLMQQMAWREQLEAIQSTQNLDELLDFSAQIEQFNRQLLSDLADLLDAQQWGQSGVLVDRLRFIKKLFVEIERVENQLTDF